MKIAYVVTVHKNPAQVGRLLRRLATDDAVFVIHVDRRAGDEVDAAIRRDERRRSSSSSPRNRCFWGGFGHVRAAVKGLDHLITHGLPFDYALWLSGQDYPLRPAPAIERYFAAAGDVRSSTTSGCRRRSGLAAAFARIEKWHLVSYVALHLYGALAAQGPQRLGPVWRRRVVVVLQTGCRVHRTLSSPRPSFVRFFEHTLHPAELFFHTIVMNSPLAESVVPDHLRYIDWSADPGPVILGVDDIAPAARLGQAAPRGSSTRTSTSTCST